MRQAPTLQGTSPSDHQDAQQICTDRCSLILRFVQVAYLILYDTHFDNKVVMKQALYIYDNFVVPLVYFSQLFL